MASLVFQLLTTGPEPKIFSFMVINKEKQHILMDAGKLFGNFRIPVIKVTRNRLNFIEAFI